MGNALDRSTCKHSGLDSIEDQYQTLKSEVHRRVLTYLTELQLHYSRHASYPGVIVTFGKVLLLQSEVDIFLALLERKQAFMYFAGHEVE